MSKFNSIVSFSCPSVNTEGVNGKVSFKNEVLSGWDIMVTVLDTGCQISVAPLDRTRNKRVKLPYALLAANETRLKVHGLQQTEFAINGQPFT